MHETEDLLEPGGQSRPAPSAIRANLGPQFIAREKPGLLARLWQRSRSPLQAPREPCVVVAVLMILDRGLALDGLVTEIGTNTVLFRQASVFIFDRTGAEVSLRFAEHDRRGRITEVSAHGYVIRLNEPLDEDEYIDFLENYGQAG